MSAMDAGIHEEPECINGEYPDGRNFIIGGNLHPVSSSDPNPISQNGRSNSSRDLSWVDRYRNGFSATSNGNHVNGRLSNGNTVSAINGLSNGTSNGYHANGLSSSSTSSSSSRSNGSTSHSTSDENDEQYGMSFENPAYSFGMDQNVDLLKDFEGNYLFEEEQYSLFNVFRNALDSVTKENEELKILIKLELLKTATCKKVGRVLLAKSAEKLKDLHAACMHKKTALAEQTKYKIAQLQEQVKALEEETGTDPDDSLGDERSEETNENLDDEPANPAVNNNTDSVPRVSSNDTSGPLRLNNNRERGLSRLNANDEPGPSRFLEMARQRVSGTRLADSLRPKTNYLSSRNSSLQHRQRFSVYNNPGRPSLTRFTDSARRRAIRAELFGTSADEPQSTIIGATPAVQPEPVVEDPPQSTYSPVLVRPARRLSSLGIARGATAKVQQLNRAQRLNQPIEHPRLRVIRKAVSRQATIGSGVVVTQLPPRPIPASESPRPTSLPPPRPQPIIHRSPSVVQARVIRPAVCLPMKRTSVSQPQQRFLPQNAAYNAKRQRLFADEPSTSTDMPRLRPQENGPSTSSRSHPTIVRPPNRGETVPVIIPASPRRRMLQQQPQAEVAHQQQPEEPPQNDPNEVEVITLLSDDEDDDIVGVEMIQRVARNVAMKYE